MQTFLLLVIAVSEVARLYLTHRKPTKVAHFKQKLEGVTKMIYDLQFKIFKTREIREDIRREYDSMKAKLDKLTFDITNWPKDKDEGEKKRLEDQVVLVERDIKRFEAQMKQLDLEINGCTPCQECPDGAEGITNQIDSLKELQIMLKSWIRRI